MSNYTTDMENVLYAIDFSNGHKQIVWGKIQSRLKSDACGLEYTELDDVAGGCFEQPGKKCKDK